MAGSGTTASGRPTGSVGTSGEGTLQSGSPSDAAVASVLDAINSSEVEAGELAAQKARDPEVRRYASDMVAAHRVAPLDKPVEAQGTNGASDFLTPLRDTHGKTMRALQSAAAGATFDRAYITAQVQAHEGALQTLERLETAARESALTERLRRTQGEVRQHLERARAIQARVSRGA